MRKTRGRKGNGRASRAIQDVRALTPVGILFLVAFLGLVEVSRWTASFGVVHEWAGAEESRIERTCREHFAVYSSEWKDVQEPWLYSRLSKFVLEQRGGSNFSSNVVYERRRLACALYGVLLGLGPENVLLSDDIANITLGMVSRHIEHARRKPLVYYHHISKTGGTSMCSLARKNGCRVAATSVSSVPEPYQSDARNVRGNNCNLYEFHDNCMWEDGVDRPRGSLSYAGDDACVERHAFSQQAKVNFMANENYDLGETIQDECRERLLSFIVLRDPISRFLSHAAHVYGGDRNKIHRQCLLVEEALTQRNITLEKGLNVTCLAESMVRLGNNYLTRSLAGQQTFTSRDLNISEEDFERSVRKLSDFDAIVFVRGFARSEEVTLEVEPETHMRTWLGFQMDSIPHHRNGNFKADYHVNLTSRDREVLEEWNSLDLRLFDLASTLYVLDSILLNVTVMGCERGDFERDHPVCRINSASKEGVPQHRLACSCGWAGSNDEVRELPGLALAMRPDVTNHTCFVLN